MSDQPTATKGDHGTVLIVAGADQYPNTPAIVAGGALRTGADIVRIAAPRRSAEQSAAFHLNTLITPLPGDVFSRDHVPLVTEHIAAADCAVIGPGIGTTPDTAAAIRSLLTELQDTACVLDAAAIPALDEYTAAAGERWVATPHAAEFEAVTGAYPPTTVEERRQAVSAAAADLGMTVLLKGGVDVVSDGTRIETSTTGHTTMTRGGTGDVLAGITATRLAQGDDPVDAAVTAAHINGAAGDRAVTRYGPGYLLEELLQEVSHTVSDHV